jgi:predicted mannosyl-3-phosphoglycerate phosphatase (HAD superfamily)
MQTAMLVIFTRVEGLLRERGAGACEFPSEVVTALVSAQVPLVLVSESNAADIREMQRTLGLVEPFVCDGGNNLHIPPAYFDDMPEAANDGWERFSFGTTGPAAAIRLLSALFLARGHDRILTVGLGCDCRDATMLGAVDVPIVVRDRERKHVDLLRDVPGAYLTTASGAAGWLEAVIGAPAPAHA